MVCQVYHLLIYKSPQVIYKKQKYKKMCGLVDYYSWIIYFKTNNNFNTYWLIFYKYWRANN